MTTSVFITGANGFIAQHIVKQLLDKNYKVIGSVRSAVKGETLKNDFHDPKFDYEVIEDITVSGAFDEPLKKHPEVTVFIHNASPFRLDVKDIKKDLYDPAIEGTKNVLQSIKKTAPQIKKVVITSSVASITTMTAASEPDTVISEDTWNPLNLEQGLSDNHTGYVASKTFAEKEAWAFVKNEKPNFTLNTINPFAVFGPQVFDSGVKENMNTSCEMFNSFIKGKGAIMPIAYGAVDVRDVARAHIHAFESDVTNFRYFPSESLVTSQYIIDTLKKHFPNLKDKITIGSPGSDKPLFEQHAKVVNDKTRAYLGKFIPIEQSIVDTASQILKVNNA